MSSGRLVVAPAFIFSFHSIAAAAPYPGPRIQTGTGSVQERIKCARVRTRLAGCGMTFGTLPQVLAGFQPALEQVHACNGSQRDPPPRFPYTGPLDQQRV